VIWAFAPVMHDGFTAMTLFARASAAAWAIGACSGWVSRLASRRRPALRVEDASRSTFHEGSSSNGP